MPFMSEPKTSQPAQRMTEARAVKLNPRVVVWIALCAAGIALMSFGAMFVTFGYRNGWW